MITQTRMLLKLETRVPCTNQMAMMEIELELDKVFKERGQYLILMAEVLRNRMADKVAEWEAIHSEPRQLKR
jgi:hypothetical protein